MNKIIFNVNELFDSYHLLKKYHLLQEADETAPDEATTEETEDTTAETTTEDTATETTTEDTATDTMDYDTFAGDDTFAEETPVVDQTDEQKDFKARSLRLIKEMLTVKELAEHFKPSNKDNYVLLQTIIIHLSDLIDNFVQFIKILNLDSLTELEKKILEKYEKKFKLLLASFQNIVNEEYNKNILKNFITQQMEEK